MRELKLATAQAGGAHRHALALSMHAVDADGLGGGI
jgi:hypothetical protein